ncbi:MAG: hypothetical protein ABI353_11445 [Isosphaeraceae bacterium]
MPLDIDLDAYELMTHVVDIETLPDPQSKGASGAPRESDWVVERANVDCLITPRRTKPEERAMQAANVSNLTLTFYQAVTLGPTRRVLYQDPDRGQRIFRASVARNAAEAGQVWVSDAIEVND